ncbi:MAG TPA: heparan-alpha-glucosaminide N-acetyltransferase [Beijerinckiaceae bacterium]|nr:heparan-alpha-glucosaminide N-acetyltransferase [Beijerinckiaceae bacterium]
MIDAQRGFALSQGRFDGVDAARGAALVAMAVYHLGWDLSFLGLVVTDVIAHPVWRALGRATAASFLFLVGVGLVLGHGRGLRTRAFLRRLAIVAGAAALVTVATRFAFPNDWVYFGILHCIAVASVVALPFVRAPVPVTLAAAALAFAAPRALASPAFDGRALAWTGLAAEPTPTVDYVPLLPWLAAVLVGVAAARLALPRLGLSGFAAWQARGPVSRPLVWAGRRSLAVYLIHQPVLLAILYPLALALGPNPAAQEAAFRRAYAANCAAAGAPAPSCAAAAACTIERLRQEGLWEDTLADRLDPERRARVNALSRGCYETVRERAQPGVPVSPLRATRERLS